MNYKIIGILILYLSTLTLPFAQAVRLNDDDMPVARTANQEALDKALYEKIKLQKMNGERFAIVLNRVRNALPAGSSPESVLNDAIELLFKDLVQEFSPEVQKSLEVKWKDSSWLLYSERTEHTMMSRPMGLSRVYGLNHFQLTLDKKFDSLPNWNRLIKMLALTHIIGPQIEILQTEGLAFYQQTYSTNETLTLTSAYWTFTQILGFVQLQKVFTSEVKRSALELGQIRSTLEVLEEQFNSDSFFLLNKYIVTQHPGSVSNNSLKKFLNQWLNDCYLQKPKKPKMAQIIDFKERKNKLIFGKCSDLFD